MTPPTQSTMHTPATLSLEHSQIIDEVEYEIVSPSEETITEEESNKGPWLIVIGTWLVQFCTYGYVSAFGVYQDHYTREFLPNRSPSEISWIGSVQLFLQYALGVVVGRIYDLGYFHYLIGVGTILQTVSLFMLSLTRPHHYPEIFLAQAVGMGLGQAMLFLPSLSIVSHHFKRRRAMATGVAVSGASVGGIVWPIILNQASRKLDFPNAIRISAAILCTFLVLANSLYSIAIPKREAVQVGLQHKPNFRVIRTDWAYLASILSAFCINLGLFFPYFYLQSYALSEGLESSFVLYLLAILNAGSVFGRVLPSFLADKLGVYNVLLPSLYISSGLGFALFGIHTSARLAVFALLYGFWSGSYVSLIPSLLVQLSSDPGELGVRMGIAFSIVAISLLGGTPIEGMFLGADGKSLEWSHPILFCGVIITCGSFGMTISKYLFIRSRRAHSRWV